jgi:hypothetical protein
MRSGACPHSVIETCAPPSITRSAPAIGHPSYSEPLSLTRALVYCRLYLRPLLAHLRKARAVCNMASGAAAPSEAQQACGGVLMGCCVDLLQVVVEVIPVD